MEREPSPLSEAGVPSDNTTLTAIIDAFVADGFDSDLFVTREGMIRCGVCHHDMPPGVAVLERLRRLEGASDPADMAAVLALTCPRCGARGTVVVRFGPEAGPADDAVLLALQDDRFPDG